MALALTPLSDAWSGSLQQKKKQPIKKNEKKIKHQNAYSSPQMQTKILGDLGMLEPEPEPEVMELDVPVVDQSTNSLNITLSNPNLVSMFRPYSNEYIEMVLMKCLSEKNNGVNQDLIDTVDTIYLIVTILLVLVIIDIIFKMKQKY